MAIHVIPEGEEDLHIKEQDCMCEPRFMMDDESGEMVWAHNLLDAEELLDDFIILKKRRWITLLHTWRKQEKAFQT